MAMKKGLLSAVLALLVGVLTTMPTRVEPIGVCYGWYADDLPEPREVIKLYKENGITAMRIYAPRAEVLDALAGTDIELMMGVDDGQLPSLANDASVAAAWVQTNIVAYPDVSFKYIVVGNEVKPDQINNVLPAMSNIWDALCSADFQGKIKVSTAVSSGVLINSYPPSATEFDSSYNMGSIIEFLASTGNPLFANIYPFFARKDNLDQIKLNYALFDPTADVVTDTGSSYTYHNLFDAMLDSVYYALEKAGGTNVSVVVTESGWPSAGNDAAGATVENACKYNQNLINHVSAGTPKKPGNVETYIFAMFNECDKPGDEVERHFGLFYPNQMPVYSINFNQWRKEGVAGGCLATPNISHISAKVVIFLIISIVF